MSTKSSPQELWNQLSEHLNKWYHQPDLEALKISLCAAVTHYYPQELPFWLLIIGKSGTGKTAIAIQALQQLPDAKIIGRVTPSCFLSSKEKGGKENSLLFRGDGGGHSQIWLFKDFTTFGSMRFEARAEVAAQLREIWDGENSSDTGAGAHHWIGKVTAIAAATPEFEEYWAALRNLGDRFTTVRWREPSESDPAFKKSRAQAGHQDEIRTRVHEIVHLLYRDKTQGAQMPEGPMMDRIDTLAEIVAQMRVHVVRESDNGRSILRIPEAEFPTRLSMSFSQLIRTHMDIMHKIEADESDFSLARRLAFDTVPPIRRKILEYVPHDGEVTYGQILHSTRLPRNSLMRQIEEMVCLGILQESLSGTNEWSSRRASLEPDFKVKLDKAQATFRANAAIALVPRRGRKASLNPDKAAYSD